MIPFKQSRTVWFALATILLWLPIDVSAQEAEMQVGDNLVSQGIPPIPASLSAGVRKYTEARSAGFVDWHPERREMLISTRFANTSQIHYVKMPGGDRKQITFFEEPVGGAAFEPQ